MYKRTISLGWDTSGNSLSDHLHSYLKYHKYDVKIVSPLEEGNIEPLDFIEVSKNIVKDVIERSSSVGILICGSGIGMSIISNKYKGIRAALCTSEYEARIARSHNDANILCLGARVIGVEQAIACLHVFLNTRFLINRYKSKLSKIEEIGQQGI